MEKEKIEGQNIMCIGSLNYSGRKNTKEITINKL